MLFLPALVLLVHAVSLVESTVKWTIHSQSCSAELQDAIIQAMIRVKSRSKLGAANLELSKKITGGEPAVKKVAQFLLGSAEYSKKADVAIELFKKYGELEGPIGFGEGLSDSPAWTGLNQNDDHYLDFVIYCAPDIGNRMVGTPPNQFEVKWNLARDRMLGFGANMLVMQEEAAAGQYKNEKRKMLGVTEVDATEDGTPAQGEAERRRIPQTITFHPLWLRTMEDYGYLMDKSIRDQICNPNAPTRFRVTSLKPIDSLMLAGIEGTLHHETFHLTAFRNLQDEPVGEAYYWDNITRHKKFVPDLMAYLAYIIELTKDGYTVKEDGSVECPKKK